MSKRTTHMCCPLFVVRKEPKRCRIFAKQMYGAITCKAGYRRVHPNVFCHASQMHDAASAITEGD